MYKSPLLTAEWWNIKLVRQGLVGQCIHIIVFILHTALVLQYTHNVLGELQDIGAGLQLIKLLLPLKLPAQLLFQST